MYSERVLRLRASEIHIRFLMHVCTVIGNVHRISIIQSGRSPSVVELNTTETWNGTFRRGEQNETGGLSFGSNIQSRAVVVRGTSGYVVL
jgi:hypothetical protein